MNDKLIAIIDKLAIKLGTTADQAWSILIKQAYISGIIDIMFGISLVSLSILVVCYVKSKTKNKNIEGNDLYARYELCREEKIMAWWVAGLIISICFFSFFVVLKSAITAFANPEYWALAKIIGGL